MNLIEVKLVETLFVTPGYGWLAEREGYESLGNRYRLVRLDDPELDLNNCASLSVCHEDYELFKGLRGVG